MAFGQNPFLMSLASIDMMSSSPSIPRGQFRDSGDFDMEAHDGLRIASCNCSPPCEALRVKELSSKEVSNMEAIICVAVHFNSRVPTGLGDVHIHELVK